MTGCRGSAMMTRSRDQVSILFYKIIVIKNICGGGVNRCGGVVFEDSRLLKE
jgi:hypothetical protein